MGRIIVTADWAVWFVFAVEYVVMMAVVRDRRAYTRQNWLMVGIILITFPLLPSLLILARLVRLVRLIRVVRLLRLAPVTARGIRAIQVALGRHEVLFISAVSIVLILLAAQRSH